MNVVLHNTRCTKMENRCLYNFVILFVVCHMPASFNVYAQEAPDVRLDRLPDDVEQFLRDDPVGSTPGQVVSRGCPEDHYLPCVPKCCNIYDGYDSGRECTASGDYFLPEFFDCPNTTEYFRNISIPLRYEYFIGDPCQKEKYILDVSQYPEDVYYLYSNGTLWYGNRLLTMDEYCVESVNGSTRVFVCFETLKKTEYKFFVYPIGLLTSIPLLLVTAVVYIGFEELRDVQGKALACHVGCLAVAYFFLALVQLASQELNSEVCTAAAFIIQFFFVACFFWLNILCFDTWRNIRTDYRDSFTRRNKSDRMKFVYYSLYAWYGPCMLTIASLVMDFEPTIPESMLKPKFGIQSCWFQSDDAALPYFYGPVGVLILINIVFFVLSAKKIYSEQKNYVKLKRTSCHAADSDIEMPPKIKIYIRALKRCVSLFCVMGINWAAEVISWIIGGSDLIWLITDLFNTLQGLIIFYIFVIKPVRVRKQVMEKLRKCFRCCCRANEDRQRRDEYCPPEDAQEKLPFNFLKDPDIRYIDASVMSLNNL